MLYFEDLNVWKEWRLLYKDLFTLFNKTAFKDYFFRDQILRATLSITNNIAEGYERQTNNELIRFLYIAKWSCWEVKSMIYLANDIWYIENNVKEKYIERLWKISVMLLKLIKSIK